MVEAPDITITARHPDGSPKAAQLDASQLLQGRRRVIGEIQCRVCPARMVDQIFGQHPNESFACDTLRGRKFASVGFGQPVEGEQREQYFEQFKSAALCQKRCP